MNKLYRLMCPVLFACLFATSPGAQTVAKGPVRIAVFVPLYLGDAFDGYSYRLDKNNIPKNILPGLEFYNGVMMAIDSFAHEGARVQVSIYDTKQAAASLQNLFNGPDLANTGLIIASFTTADEVKLFADMAVNKNIPLISATYPNVGGVSNNPFFVLLNSSFQTHLTGIYSYLKNNYPNNSIVAFRKVDASGTYIKNKFTELNKANILKPLKLKWIDLPEKFTATDVIKQLDSLTPNVIFVASPNESFGLSIVKMLSDFEQYQVTAIGMPTWDGIKELDGRQCKNVEIIYSTPFNYSRNDQFEKVVTKNYKAKYYSRPSDMVFRGFEITYHFGKLLIQYNSNLINNLSTGQYRLFNDFDIKPVKSSEANPMPDYLENKKLYFVKKQDGNFKEVISSTVR